MDLDYIHSQFLAAARGISKGKGLTEFVAVRPYGQQVQIGPALYAACEHLREVLHAEDRDIVNAAFHVFEASPPSDVIDECANALIELSMSCELKDLADTPRDGRASFRKEFTRPSDNKIFTADVVYRLDYPRTYEATVRFADDDQMTIRDQFKGPLIDIAMDDELLRESVVQAVQEKINASDAS